MVHEYGYVMTKNNTAKSKAFGALLRELRLSSSRRITQRELAERADLWTTHVSEIERGVRPCGPHVASRLALALELKGMELQKFLVLASQTSRRTIRANPNPNFLMDLIADKLEENGIVFHAIQAVSPLRDGHILVVLEENKVFKISITVRTREAS